MDDVLGISAHDTPLNKGDWAVIDEEFEDKTVLFVSLIFCPYAV